MKGEFLSTGMDKNSARGGDRELTIADDGFGKIQPRATGALLLFVDLVEGETTPASWSSRMTTLNLLGLRNEKVN
ncbi:hypothetical protein BH11ARM1_BH11ARM1_07700 [soil metagenome]